MRSVTVRLDDLRTTILCLGYVGENEHTRINIDAKKMYDQYPSASASLTVCPPEGESYPAVITRDVDMVIWDITDSDLVAEGSGEIQLSFTQGETVAKTFIGRFKVSRSLVPTGDIPSGIDDFLTRAGAALTAIPETIDEALAEAKASGEFDGADGQDGQDGADGFSPIATVTKSGNKATISITDANGTTTAEVTDGADGAPGQDGAPGIDGFSPRATVSKSGSTATITITDAAGTTTAQISDGDGADIIDDTAGSGDTDKVWSADKSSSLLTEINSRYTKPNTGIPATDMASSVQNSLNNADSAYQKPQTGIPASDMEEGVIPDITGKADKTVTDALQKNKAPIIIDSAEGNPIVLTDGADGLPVESMKIHFLPKQDTSGGDPSPSHVCPISGWSGVTANRAGKNLLKVTAESATKYTVDFTVNSDGSVTADGTATSGTAQLLLNRFYPVEGETSYKFNGISGGGSSTYRIAIVFYAEGGSYISEQALYDGDNSFTFPSSAQYADIYFRVINGATVNDVTILPMMRLVSVADDTFEPYTGQSYPVTFPDGQTIYGGMLDAVTGVLTVDKQIYNLSDISWSKDTNRPGIFYGGIKGRERSSDVIACSTYLVTNTSISTSKDKYISGYENYGGQYIYLRDTDFAEMTATEMKDAVTGQLVYKLATSIEILLDPITVQTLLGDNTIWTDADGTIELDYRADTKLFIAKQKTDIRATIAPIEDGATASKAYSAGKFFYRGGNFCKAKTSIASGATFTLNTNYQITTVADELFALN